MKNKYLKKLVANSLATKNHYGNQNQLITTKKIANLFEMFNRR
jgi:predicted transcriptional regulator